MADFYLLIKLSDVSPESSIPELLESSVTSTLNLVNDQVQWYTTSIDCRVKPWVEDLEDVHLIQAFDNLNTFNF